VPDAQYKLSRKNAFVSLTNLSDAFNRMISEPKNKQKNIRELNQFVVSSHMLTSHIATLAYYAQPPAQKNNSYDFSGAIAAIKIKLNNAIAILSNNTKDKKIIVDENAWRLFNNKVNALTENRKKELQNGILESETRKELSGLKPIADQFNFIMNIATTLEKQDVLFKNDNVAKA